MPPPLFLLPLDPAAVGLHGQDSQVVILRLGVESVSFVVAALSGIGVKAGDSGSLGA